MGLAHVGDDAAGGLGGLGQPLYVAGVAGPHLHHGYLVLGLEAEERLRHAHVVVEVALRAVYAVLLGEHGGGQFLGGGLAVGACYAYHGYAEAAAVLARQHLEGVQAVVHEQATAAPLRAKNIEPSGQSRLSVVIVGCSVYRL